MSYITFVVKHSGRQEGFDELARQFRKHEVCAMLMYGGQDFNVYRCGMEYLERLTMWFCETASVIPGKGFPDGALLVYSIQDGVRA